MRIITGSARGCRLKAPKGMITRPTADRVKESLFNILGAKVWQAEVLDLFAGTGNLGLEALSRGAAHAVFVDQNAESVSLIRENALHTKLADSAEIVRSEVLSALERFARMGRRFELVFCDPPYEKGLAQKVVLALDTLDVLAEEALVVVEHGRKEMFDLPLSRLCHTQSRQYGATEISFFSHAKNFLDAKVLEEE